MATQPCITLPANCILISRPLAYLSSRLPTMEIGCVIYIQEWPGNKGYIPSVELLEIIVVLNISILVHNSAYCHSSIWFGVHVKHAYTALYPGYTYRYSLVARLSLGTACSSPHTQSCKK